MSHNHKKHRKDLITKIHIHPVLVDINTLTDPVDLIREDREPRKENNRCQKKRPKKP
jgi:hypothetical protein